MPFENAKPLIRDRNWDPQDPRSSPEVSPLDGLPPSLAKAVAEVHRQVKAPLAMVTASALGAISLVCQDAINVKSGAGLISPCSLFFLTISESGDRKSTVDRIFTKPIVDFEDLRHDKYKNELFEHNAALMAWNRIQKNILTSIKKSDSVGSAFEQLKIALHEHNKIKPPAPARQKLIYSNATPESIVYGMYKNWPSAGIVSDEAGGILNGQAMGDLGMINQLWDGSALTVDRKTSESFSLKNARLTISLMTQESSVRKFIDRGDKIARGIGFLARCLVAKPESMRGGRVLDLEDYKGIDEIYAMEIGSIALSKFKQRLEVILNKNLELRQHSSDQKKVLELSSTAKTAWVVFYNEVEVELKASGNWESVKDAASKIAENAARLAALFHYFDDEQGDISEASMNYAVITCRIYLNNFKTLFGAYDYFSEEIRDIDKMVNWINTTTSKQLSVNVIQKNDLLKHGPVRKLFQLNQVIAYLKNRDAIEINDTGKSSFVTINLRHPLFEKN